MEHDDDVQEVTVSLDAAQLAMVAECASGPRVMVTDVQTSNVNYVMEDIPRANLFWVSTRILGS
jgi:protein tyrosine phosphatase (PTP) superfamily phosphohydrolase (DUF442 family)